MGDGSSWRGLFVVGHCLLVGCLLWVIGGVLLGANIQAGLAARDSQNAELLPPDSIPEVATNERLETGAEQPINQIPRIRVAAISMPLGTGFLILLAGLTAWLARSVQAAQIAATLAGVAGVLMLILSLEHWSSLLSWGTSPLGPSAAALLIAGLLCLSLPVHAWRAMQSHPLE